MSTLVSIADRPGIAVLIGEQPAAGVDPMGEQERRTIIRDGLPVGFIVYLRRPAPGGGSAYGWRPASKQRGALLSQVDAIDAELAPRS